MRVVGPGSSKTPLTVKEIEARVEAELLYLDSLRKRGMQQDEERKRLTDLSKWFTRECSKLPPVEAVAMIMRGLKR